MAAEVEAIAERHLARLTATKVGPATAAARSRVDRSVLMAAAPGGVTVTVVMVGFLNPSTCIDRSSVRSDRSVINGRSCLAPISLTTRCGRPSSCGSCGSSSSSRTSSTSGARPPAPA